MKKEKFEKNAVVYCRVSANKQAEEGESLELQENISRGIAKIKEANILPDEKVFGEPFTGSKMSRPVFDEMMKFIKTSPKPVHYLIIRDIDRLTRGGAGDYQKIKSELEKLGVEIIDSYGLIQPAINSLSYTGFEYDWSKFSPSSMAETIKAEGAKDERRTILTRLIGAEIGLVQKGYQIGRSNDGFINKRVYVEGKKRTIQIPCPERQDFYKEMFKLRASGTINDNEIVDRLNAMGFTTRKQKLWNKKHTEVIGYRGQKPLAVKQLQRIIQKTIYCGIICKKWTHNKPIKAQFDGFIGIEEFNKANRGKVFIKTKEDGTFELLHNFSPNRSIRRRNRYNPLFPYKEDVLCPLCTIPKPFLGSSTRGKSGEHFPAYHCARGHKYFGVSKKKFDDNFESFIKSLDFDTNKIKAIEAGLFSVYSSRKQELDEFTEKVASNIETLEEKQKENIEAFKKTESKILREKLEKDIEELENQILKSKEQKENNPLCETDIRSFIKYTRYLMEHHEEMLLKEDNPMIRKQLMALVFDESPTYFEILSGTPKISFLFAKTKELARASSPDVRPGGIEPSYPA